MKKLDANDISKIEKFMEDDVFDSVNHMLESFKRLRKFGKEIKKEIWRLDDSGDLE